MKAPDIDFRSNEWQSIKRALYERQEALDSQNRSLGNDALRTMQIRVEIDVIDQILAWDKPGPDPQPVPSYAVRQFGA